ncbi:MAG: fibronectin type III domain-containing protein [Clostridiales bacterium]|nr:fibronectin type III domain-containing protein [Clostridiales bacterium]
MANKCTDVQIAQQTGSDSVYATWSCSLSNIDHFNLRWYYTTGDGVAFLGSDTDVASYMRNATYSPPDNATKVALNIIPVSETYTSNDVEVSYWTAETVRVVFDLSTTAPDQLSSPTVEISNKYKLTASVTVSDSNVDKVEFYVAKRSSDTSERLSKAASGVVEIGISGSSANESYAGYTCTVDAGAAYRVQCRGINEYTSGSSTESVYGEWSDWSDFVETVPAAVTNVSVSAYDETTIKVTWTKSSTATSYEIEYTTNKEYFDSSSDTSTVTVTSTTGYVTGVESGDTYYVRVRATNEQGESAWSSILSVVIGETPEAPTTWSSKTVAYVGDTVNLYWVHNAADNSTQQSAIILIARSWSQDGSTMTETETITVDNTLRDESEQDDTSVYTLDLSDYSDGEIITWRVKTCGITGEYSEFSVARKIKIYEPATMSIYLESDTLTEYPYTIQLRSAPSSQIPTGYYISITAGSSYEGVNALGESELVLKGEEIFSTYLSNTSHLVEYSLTPSVITLADGISYTVTATVGMNTGMSATVSDTFTASLPASDYNIDAKIGIDKNKLVAYITPYVTDDDGNAVSGLTMDVYRREADGSFTEIETGLSSGAAVSVTDPHPALDYARYRIVVTNSTTGAIDYQDLPGYPVNVPAIVIQWDEDWSDFDYDEVAAPQVPAWTGSMIKLPWNIDITESCSLDTEKVEYIGRSYPVSYYGTQQGSTATWNTDIVKSDKEMIYALRRLAAYQGDVYVREPTGTGYWAQITVSMNIKHLELVIPVTLTVTRVEGGA